MCRIEKEVGPAHEKGFLCSVHIETVDGVLVMQGDTKPRVKDAENSAASFMIRTLYESRYPWCHFLSNWLLHPSKPTCVWNGGKAPTYRQKAQQSCE